MAGEGREPQQVKPQITHPLGARIQTALGRTERRHSRSRACQGSPCVPCSNPILLGVPVILANDRVGGEDAHAEVDREQIRQRFVVLFLCRNPAVTQQVDMAEFVRRCTRHGERVVQVPDLDPDAEPAGLGVVHSGRAVLPDAFVHRVAIFSCGQISTAAGSMSM